MVSPELIWLAGALAVMGIALLRMSWGRPGRAAGLNALGWAALAIGVVIGGAVAGAWGIAVTSLFAVGTAIAILAKAVFEHPRRQRPARPLRETEALNGVGGTRIGQALATFAIAGPLALVVSVLFALAARLALIAAGAGEANGNVAVLGLVPLVWPILAFVLLITQTRGKQLLLTSAVSIAALALAVLVGGF